MKTEKINILQNKFHLLLEQYLNGYVFSKTTKILFPLITKIQIKSNIDLISDINQILNINVIPKSNKEMAQYISTIYISMKGLDIKEELMHKRVKPKYTFNADNYANPQKRIFNNLISYMESKNLDTYVDLFMIHGSYSTLDYEENISDLDTLILLKDTVLVDYKKLIELQSILFNALEYFYEIDLLQHHGFFILTEYDKNYFNETFFPTMLFEYSTVIYTRNKEIDFFIRKNEVERKNILLQTIKYLESHNPNSFDRLMTYKTYFQVLQLIPIAYLQYKNIQTYKKYSFDLFLKEFPQYRLFFNNIYQLRLNWSQNSIQNLKKKKFLYKFLPNKLLFYFNSKFEYVDVGLKNQFGDDSYKNNIIPLLEDLKRKLS